MLFSFSLLNANSSLYEAEVEVELARKLPKVEWTETSLPRQVNISLLPGFVEPATAIASSERATVHPVAGAGQLLPWQRQERQAV